MTNTTDLTAPMFTDDEAARLHFEGLRWDGGVPVCFHCGVVGDATLVKRDEELAAKRKKKARQGLYYCRACGGQFTATMGTVFEDSHIPMKKWLLAMHLMNASKKGCSALQLQRMLGLGSYRTAWFMAMRIREAMAPLSNSEPPLGGEGKVVEADETYYGPKKERPTRRKDGQPFMADRPGAKGKGRGPAGKRSVVALMERGGSVRTFHVGDADKSTVAHILAASVDRKSRLHTDESPLYKGADRMFASHETVKHSAKEYARGDVTTNSIEGFFNVFKRGMNGVYQHCDEKYLQRYLIEFEWRHNHRQKLGYSDKERAALTVKNATGKRLTLRPLKGQQAAPQ